MDLVTGLETKLTSNDCCTSSFTLDSYYGQQQYLPEKLLPRS